MLVPLTKEIIQKHLADMISMSKQLTGDYWQGEHYLSDLNRKWELSYAILSPSELLGFMIVSDKEKAHHLHRIVIREDLIGKGYGKLLLNKFESDARNANKQELTLKVHPTNKNAIGVYEKYGYKKEAEDGGNYTYALKLQE